MSPELIFMWTGKVFWILVLAAILIAVVAGAVAGFLWAAWKTYDGAASWLGARYVLDPANKEKVKEAMQRWHISLGLDADKMNEWIARVWKRRDELEPPKPVSVDEIIFGPPPSGVRKLWNPSGARNRLKGGDSVPG